MKGNDKRAYIFASLAVVLLVVVGFILLRPEGKTPLDSACIALASWNADLSSNSGPGRGAESYRLMIQVRDKAEAADATVLARAASEFLQYYDGNRTLSEASKSMSTMDHECQGHGRSN
jgi:hypothetical protein